MNLKKYLTCSFCFKILKSPITLPCMDTICGEHLTEMKSLNQNSVKCFTCNQKFRLDANHHFETNNTLKKLLDDEVFLSDEEKSLRNTLQTSVEEFFHFYEEFHFLKTRLDLEFHEHFQELRLKIDLHREKLKENIDDIYMEMIEQTKKIEASYVKSLNKNLTLEASLWFDLNEER